MFQIDNIREKKYSEFYKMYETSGKIKLVEALAEGLNKRTYFTIDSEGNISRKTMNRGLYLITTIDKKNYKEVIKEIIDVYVDLTQREKIKKIDRLSKYSLEKLTSNFNKVFSNGDRIFGLKYGKELFLRDKELFFKLLFDYVLLEDIDTNKATMAWSLYELLKESEFSDEVFYVAISYILQKESNFSSYERISKAKKTSISKEAVLKLSTNSLLESENYGKILNQFTYEKEDIYIEILKQYLV
ncbi:MAG: hypothetical protein KAH04_00100 [Psychrilyobacter sp.]|nr:hypothetical protein [Psychrilyobacter sp.]